VAKLKTNLSSPQGLLVLAMLSCLAPTAKAQTLSPTTVSFGNWVVQTTSTAKTIVLSNTQTLPLTINSISVSGNFAQTSKCPITPKTLATGASCKISITFTPTALGASTGTLSVADSSSTSPQTAQLSGNGVYPAVLSPSSVAFGDQFVNTTSTVKVVTLVNNQTVPLTIAGISTSGDFAQTSNCPVSPNTLGARLSCQISINFLPTVVGALTGTLTIDDSAANAPQTATLSGTGTAPVTLAPTGLTFASQVVGTTSSGKSVTLRNDQGVPLTISQISTAGDFSQASTTCPLSPNTLGAGASCSISVAFTPTAPGARIGTLNVADSASTSPQTMSLSGTGTLNGLLSISVTPANPTLSFGNQQQFVATGTWPGGVQVNITNFVAWSSSAPTVVSVSSTGLAQSVTQGAANITASYGSISGSTTASVTPPALTSIVVIPGNPSIPVGAYEQFTAVLSYSDGTTKDTTSSVTWSSSATTVASITSSGLTSALMAGSSTITASLGSVTGSTILTVSQPQCVTPPSGLMGWWTGDGNTVDIAGNNSGTLQNGATYGNGEVGQAFSFPGNGASVLINSPVYSPTAGTLMFWFLPTGGGALTGSYDGTDRTPGLSVDSNGNVDWEFGDLSSQESGQVGLNQWSQVALTYSTSGSEVSVNVYLNGSLVSSAIATPLSSWYPQVAFGTYLGGQEPSFAGSMDEIAIFNQALNAEQIQSIYDAFSAGMCKPSLQSIALTPVNPTMAVGLSQQFDAAGSYSDGTIHDLTTSASWSSSNPAVATVSASGQAIALATGSSTIAAALGAQTGSTNLSVIPSLVSIQISPQNPSISAGTTQPFSATGTFSDGSMQDVTASVSWSSSLPAVAVTTTGGLASGIAVGQATIVATAGAVSGSTLLTVTPATTAVLTGITVSPTNPSVWVSGTLQLTATGVYSDGSMQNLTNAVTWYSSNLNVASVTTTGLASGLTTGTTTISATYQSVSGSTSLTVTVSTPVLQSIAVTPANASVVIGQSQQLVATGQYSDGSTQNLTSSVIWSSSQPPVAGITSAGLASGLNGGSVIITAVLGSINASATLNVNPVALVSIAVTAGNLFIAPGTNQQFAATGTYADGSTFDLTTSATWSSSLPSTATVNATGLATNAATGQTIITASAAGINGSSTLTVTSAALVSIAVTPAVQTIPIGTTEQFVATGSFSDGSVQNITLSVQWSSSVGSVATIGNVPSSSGLVTSVSAGSSSISATSGSISASTTLTVSSVALTSITVSPATQSIAPGTTQQFTATGNFSDGSTQNVTTSVSWSSGNTAVATVSSSGLGTSLAAGTATISATLGGISGSAPVIVTSASVVSITAGPSAAVIPLGLNQQFTAVGTFSDGSTQDVTSAAHWSSSVPGAATVSNTPGSNGIAASTGGGTTVIAATLGGMTGSGNLTVSTATLTAIEISPQGPSILFGGTEPFTATGEYSDGTVANITTIATWASSSATVATISNTPGSQGLGASAGSGTTTISASLNSVTASTALTVQDSLMLLSIAPANSFITLGADQQFTATGTYLSGITEDMTNSVVWSSSNSAVAVITAGGLAMSAAPGQTAISATSGSVAASDSLTVGGTDALGTAEGAPISCPAGGLVGASCHAVTITCPNISTFTGYVKVNYPTGAPAGTVLFSTNGNGTALYDTEFQFGSSLLNTLLGAGFAVAQISWGHPFAVQPDGWQTGPGGIRAVACRYATMAQWIYTNIHQANSAAPFCATGNSAGGEEIGQSLSHYGLGSIFTMVEPTSGPPFARQDWACDCLQPKTVNSCGVPQGYCVGLGNAQDFIDPAYSAPICSEEVATHSTTYDSVFLQDSILAPDATLSYPNTFVKFVYGTLDTSTAPNQGALWQDAITNSKASSCVADAPHNIADVSDGAQQIANDIMTFCKLPAK